MTEVTEQMVISTFTRVCGTLSMLGSGYIMYEVLASQKKRQGTYFRLMFVMSFLEFCDGLACLLGSWAVPPEPIPWWGASGTHGSCMFQAFLIQASMASSLYNAALAIYYLLCIRYNWSERLIKQKVEPWMHGICLTLGYGMAIASLFLGIYGSLGPVCMVARYPPDCKETYKYGYTDCIYGDNASLYDVIFYEIWLWISILIAAGAMCFVWSSVRNQENRNATYTQEFQNNNNNSSSGRQTSVVNRKYSKRFAVQGAFYVVVFYLCHIFATFSLAIYHATGEWNMIFMLLGAIFDPLEGFLNFLVYMRPRSIRKWRERKRRNNNTTTTNNNNNNNPSSSVSNNNNHHENSTTSAVSREQTHFFQSVIKSFGRSLTNERAATTTTTRPPGNNTSTTTSNDGSLRQEEREQMDLDAY